MQTDVEFCLAVCFKTKRRDVREKVKSLGSVRTQTAGADGRITPVSPYNNGPNITLNAESESITAFVGETRAQGLSRIQVERESSLFRRWFTVGRQLYLPLMSSATVRL